MRRALAIDEQSYGEAHPEVAVDLNNQAHLLQTTNRLSEAERLMRRMVEIFHRFTLSTGHQHPNMEVGISNYTNLLAESGLDETEIQARIESILK